MTEVAAPAGPVEDLAAAMPPKADLNDVPDDTGQPSVYSESFQNFGYDIRVSNVEGFLCKVRCKALVDLPPEEIHAIFTNPDNSGLFRSVDGVRQHVILQENERFQQVLVEQLATVGVLWIKHTFSTLLQVTHDNENLRTSFRLLRPGMMTDFQGYWDLTAVDADKFLEMIQHRVPGTLVPENPRSSRATKCLLYLEQDVAPAVAQKVPPMFHGLLRKVCAAAITAMLKDIQTVVALRHHGVPLETVLSSQLHGRRGLKVKKLGWAEIGKPKHRAAALRKSRKGKGASTSGAVAQSNGVVIGAASTHDSASSDRARMANGDVAASTSDFAMADAFAATLSGDHDDDDDDDVCSTIDKMWERSTRGDLSRTTSAASGRAARSSRSGFLKMNSRGTSSSGQMAAASAQESMPANTSGRMVGKGSGSASTSSAAALAASNRTIVRSFHVEDVNLSDDET